MVLVMEAIVLCVIFSVMVYIMSQDPLKTLYNYPPKIQERVKSLEMYKDNIPTSQKKVAVKVIFSIMVIVIISLILRFVNGYTTFIEGFGYGFLLWTIVNIYDAVVIDICWFCQNPRFVFEGTEDMVAEYHDYWFHIKESLKGEVIALGVCVVVGLVIQFVL